MKRTRIRALRKAVKAAGGQTKLAERISTTARPITQSHVWNWLNRDLYVPAEVVLDIERETGVSRHDLRPDVFGKPSRQESEGVAACAE